MIPRHRMERASATTYASDLAEAHVLAISVLDERPEVLLNLGSGISHSNLEVVDMVKRVMCVDFEVRIGDRRLEDPALAKASKGNPGETFGFQLQQPGVRALVRDAWAGRQNF